MRRRCSPRYLYPRARMLLAILTCGSLIGCAAPTTQPNQITVAKDLQRDTDRARRLTMVATASIDQGNWKDAEFELNSALDADITYGPAHNNLGTVYMHEGNLYQAACEFDYAVKLMPYRPEPKNNLGLALEAAGKLDEAVDYYNQALKLEPENPQLLGNDARASIRRGDKNDRVRHLLEQVQAIDTRPEWVQWAKETLMLLGQPTTQAPMIP